jgi:hypothetical protein
MKRQKRRQLKAQNPHLHRLDPARSLEVHDESSLNL